MKYSEDKTGSTSGDISLEKAYQSMRAKLDSMSNLYNLPVDDMEDVLQESYLRLSPHNNGNETEAKGRFWLTVRNIVVDTFRKRKPMTVLSEVDSFKSFEENPAFEIDHLKIRNQMREILSPRQWKIMHLLVEQGLDYPEIALEMDMAEGAVRTNVSRARKLLREKLEL